MKSLQIQTISEKRKLTRLKLLCHLRVFDRLNFRLLGHLADIHAEGMMVISEQAPKPGRIHQIKIVLPEPIEDHDEIHFPAKVLWCRKYENPIFHQAGYKMERLDQRCIHLLERLVHRFGFRDVFQSKVVRYYRGIEGYNCAQAILIALSQRFDVDEALLDTYAGYGGGRAPKGTCGALYTIQQLSRSQKAAKRFEERFIEEVGSTQCDEILTMGRLSCTGCIFTAYQIIQDDPDNE